MICYYGPGILECNVVQPMKFNDGVGIIEWNDVNLITILLPLFIRTTLEPINIPAIPDVERPSSAPDELIQTSAILPVVEFPRWVLKKFFPHREPSKHPMKLRGSIV
jgi:hypothetical protein